MTYKILKLTLGLLLISTLTACDSDIFNQFFRNPYIVEIAELDKMEANKWYDFDTEVKALNRIQEMVVSFDGSSGEGVDVFYKGDESIYKIKSYPEKDVKVSAILIDSMGNKYNWSPTGLSSGILFSDYKNKIPMGNAITKIRIKGNVEFNNVKITWISRTGK